LSSPSTLSILEAPQSPAAAESAYAALRSAAYRHLARREHSACELRRKLQTAVSAAAAMVKATSATSATAASPASGGRGKRKLGEDTVALATLEAAALPALLDRLLAELVAAGAQSDARFAEHLSRWRFNTGRGPVKLRFELTEHQIAPELIEQVMAEYESHWHESAARTRARKFGDKAPGDYKTWAKQARFLQQRGFKSEHIEPFDGAR